MELFECCLLFEWNGNQSMVLFINAITNWLVLFYFNGSHAHNNTITELKRLFFCLFIAIYPFRIPQAELWYHQHLTIRLIRWPCISIAVFLYPYYIIRVPAIFFIDCFLCIYVISYKSKWHDSVAILCCRR